MKTKYLGAITLVLILGFSLDSSFKLRGQDMTDEQKAATAKEFYDAGLDALKNKKYDKARDFFIKTISYQEAFAPAYAKLGDAYCLLREDELGYENYNKFIALADKSNDSTPELAKLYQEISGKIKKFRAIEEKASALSAEFIAKLLELGQASQEAGDYFGAAEIFSFTLQMDDRQSQAAEGLARAKDDSIKNEPVERLHPDQELVKVYYDAGLDLMKQNKHAEAVEKFNNALTYRPASPEVFFSLAECHEKLRDIPKTLLNYGFCRKYLQARESRSKEDETMLAKAVKCLEKLNPNIAACAKAKKDYVAKALSLARDYLNNKYQYLAYTLLCSILKVDRQNKEADALLLKIGQDVMTYQNKKQIMDKLGLKPKKAPVIIFNGKDLDDWSLHSLEKGGALAAGCFSVDAGKIIVNPANAFSNQIIYWEKEMPAIGLFSVEFQVVKAIQDDATAMVSVLRNITSKESGVTSLNIRSWTFTDPKVDWKKKHTIDCVISKDLFQASLDAGDLDIGKTDNPETVFGLHMRNYKLEILSIVMQELEPQETIK